MLWNSNFFKLLKFDTRALLRQWEPGPVTHVRIDGARHCQNESDWSQHRRAWKRWRRSLEGSRVPLRSRKRSSGANMMKPDERDDLGSPPDEITGWDDFEVKAPRKLMICSGPRK
jgi:hypothetical protein